MPVDVVKLIQNVLLTETVKIFFLISIGALILSGRSYITTKAIAMAKFSSALSDGLKVLASDGFKTLPASIEDLKKSLSELSERVEKVEYRVGPNGGGSILDGVNALRRTTKSIEESVLSLNLRNSKITDAVGLMMFTADSHGRNTWTSKPLQILTGYSAEEGFEKNKWENLFVEEDRAEYISQWNAAVALANEDHPADSPDGKEELVFSKKTRFKHAVTGKAIPVHVKATWLPDRTIVGMVTLVRNDEHTPLDDF